MMNAQYMIQMASNPSNWRRTHKKGYEVYVCRPLPGAQCINRLEGAHYVTDQNKQFIISGTVGETWVIDINNLAKTYIFADGTPITADTLSKKSYENGQMDWQKLVTRPDKNTNWAMLIPKQIQNFPVQTSWGDILLANRPGIGHGLGDFLVCTDNGNGQPNLNDVRVVNGEVFPTTYDLHSFPNMFPPSVTTVKTPYPQQRFMRNTPVKSRVDELAIEIAKGLKSKGHRIGRATNDSIETKSFSVDNGTYGIILNIADNGESISIMCNTSGNWEELACWFLDDNDMHYNIERMHSIISGSRKNNAHVDRAVNTLKDDSYTTFVKGEPTEEFVVKRAAEKVLKFIETVKGRLEFDSVKLEDIDRNTYRIIIERKGINGCGIIDFDNSNIGYGCYLDDYCNEVAGAKVDANNISSIVNVLRIIYNMFNRY